jgi:hypothetical protein
MNPSRTQPRIFVLKSSEMCKFPWQMLSLAEMSRHAIFGSDTAISPQNPRIFGIGTIGRNSFPRKKIRPKKVANFLKAEWFKRPKCIIRPNITQIAKIYFSKTNFDLAIWAFGYLIFGFIELQMQKRTKRPKWTETRARVWRSTSAFWLWFGYMTLSAYWLSAF